MNDGIEYARLIGVPTTSCEYVKSKKKIGLFKKKSIIKKVNDDLSSAERATKSRFSGEEYGIIEPYADGQVDQTDKAVEKADISSSESEVNTDVSQGCYYSDCDYCDQSAVKSGSKREGILGKIITVQTVAAFLLVVAILLTNIFWENSGMNMLIKSVFGNTNIEEKVADERVYSDFSLNLPVKSDGVSLVKGVIEVKGDYSVYPVCEGKIDKVEKSEDGKYTVTLKHSENFFSVIEGADLVYFTVGESVSKNIPVCHTSDKAQVYLYENGSLLTDYVAVENSIVFEK